MLRKISAPFLAMLMLVGCASNSGLVDLTKWKTYTNDQYKFKIQYPAEFQLTAVNKPVDGFYFTKGSSSLAVLPKGEYDTDLPSEKPLETTESRAEKIEKTFKIREWKLSDGSSLLIYNLMTPTKDWITCTETLKNCNRIEIFAQTPQDLNTLRMMAATLSFQ